MLLEYTMPKFSSQYQISTSQLYIPLPLFAAFGAPGVEFSFGSASPLNPAAMN
jgi:hypothetical protein